MPRSMSPCSDDTRSTNSRRLSAVNLNRITATLARPRLAGALGQDAEAGLVLVHEEEAGVGLGRGQRQAEVAAPAAEVHHEGLGGEAALRQHRPHVVHLLPLAGPSVTAQQCVAI